MSIEALYPYIAVAYGTFGIVFGVMLWWKTQRRIDRTKSAIETQVANAVVDIRAQVDDKLGNIPKVDVDAIVARLADEMPEIDLDAIGAKVKGEVEMFYRQEQANLVRATQRQLSELNLDGVMQEEQEALLQQIPASMMAMREVAKFKVSSAYRKENPLGALVVELGKMGAMQLLEQAQGSRIASVLGSEGGQQATTGGHRPGL